MEKQLISPSNLARSVDINQLEADGTDENVVTAILNDPSSVSGSGWRHRTELRHHWRGKVSAAICAVLYFKQKRRRLYAELLTFKQDNIPVGCAPSACQPYMFRWPLLEDLPPSTNTDIYWTSLNRSLVMTTRCESEEVCPMSGIWKVLLTASWVMVT